MSDRQLPSKLAKPDLFAIMSIMNQDKFFLSQEKYEELKSELDQLKTVERKRIAEHLEYAKSLGDLSENAEYHEARDKQADIEDRISNLEAILKKSEIVNHRTGSIATIGSRVSISKDNGNQQSYTIVGSEEADMANNKISYLSPLGEALLGKKKGETCTIKTPKGEVIYKIIEVK